VAVVVTYKAQQNREKQQEFKWYDSLLNILLLIDPASSFFFSVYYQAAFKMSNLPPVYIASAVRTPVGSFLG